MSVARSLSLFFAAGVVGALASSAVVWGSAELGLPQAFGVALAPKTTPAWLYQRIRPANRVPDSAAGRAYF
ncbi:hypothetical protein KJ059_12920, partial [Myxococcota bacterium]|nr:hypothetical protein [Myxococcota bacterium]